VKRAGTPGVTLSSDRAAPSLVPFRSERCADDQQRYAAIIRIRAMARRRLRQLASCAIALWAMLLLTLAPALMQVDAARADSGASSICSAASLIEAASPDRSKAPGDGTHAFAHCPYCGLQAHLVVPPGPRAIVAGARWAVREHPRRFLQAPVTAWVWSTAQPRAPPLA